MRPSRDRKLISQEASHCGPDSLPENAVELRAPRPQAPSVHRFGEVVLKTYDNCSRLLRQTVGRLAVSRECWALKRLAGSSHVPRLLERPNPWSMKTDFIAGIPLEKLSRSAVDAQKMAHQALSLLQDLESAGVAHGDLGHDHWQSMGRESNLIWTENEELVVIDFAGAVPLESSLPLLGKIGQALGAHDSLLSAKLQFHFPHGGNSPSPHTHWPLELWELLRVLGKL